jgi:hypothetical protein
MLKGAFPQNRKYPKEQMRVSNPLEFEGITYKKDVRAFALPSEI